MYPEITSRLRAIEDELNGPDFYPIDHRLEKIVNQLRGGLEFLAKKVWDLDLNKPARPCDPHRHIPGIDD